MQLAGSGRIRQDSGSGLPAHPLPLQQRLRRSQP
jgi:hypothetical protein